MGPSYLGLDEYINYANKNRGTHTLLHALAYWWFAGSEGMGLKDVYEGIRRDYCTDRCLHPLRAATTSLRLLPAPSSNEAFAIAFFGAPGFFPTSINEA